MATCLCRWVTPVDNQLPLLVLQHPLEARHAKGSVRLLGLSLSRLRCVVGEGFDDPTLAALLGPPGRSLLLFPPDLATGATTGDGDGCSAQPGRAEQLVLLDGTWRQARQMLRGHTRLQVLPRWALPTPPPSRYAIRRAQRPQQRSTFEAACLALGRLENRPSHYAPLLAAFSGWVAAVAARGGP